MNPIIPKLDTSDFPEPERLLYEKLSPYIPPEKLVDYFRVLQRLRQMSKQDDLVTLIDGTSLCALLIKDILDQLIVERSTLLNQLDLRINQCEKILAEANAVLAAKFSRLDGRIQDSKLHYERAIYDFRKHVDARVKLAENRNKEISEELRIIYKRVFESTEEMSDYLESLKTSRWSKIKTNFIVFLLGYYVSYILLRSG